MNRKKLFTLAAGIFALISLLTIRWCVSEMIYYSTHPRFNFYYPFLLIPIACIVVTTLFIILVKKEQGKINIRKEQINKLNNWQEISDSKEEVIKMIEPMIKAQLKSPISAIFCEPNELRIEYDIDNVYNIYGYVNSQNSYGAMIKTGFKVKARNSGNKWEVINAGMENKFIKTLATNYIVGIVIALILFAISYFIISSLL